MSTSEFENLIPGAAGKTSGFVPDAGVPDIGLIAQLANELFSAPPTHGGLASLPSTVNTNNVPSLPSKLESQLPQAGASQFPAQLPFEDALRTLQSLTQASAPLETSNFSQTGISSEKLASAPASIASRGPTYIENYTQGQSALDRGSPLAETSLSGIPLPFEADLRSLFPAPGTATSAIKEPNTSKSAQVSSYYFLDESTSPRNGVQGQVPAITSAHPPFDINAIRRDFPILKEHVHGKPLIWLDNAATTQKPQAVIDRLSYFYQHENSNIHRAAHELAARATDAYEGAREKIRRFINAPSVDEVIFVRGTTEAINLVAKSWGWQNIGEGDEIVITWLEHHANIVPWQQLCTEKGAKLRVVPVDNDGQVLLEEYQKLLTPRTKLVSFTQVSNALGTVTPARQMVEMAHRVGARVLVDGAQSVSHMRADVQYLDCDWFVFSGHKVFGPTGIGALYGKAEVLEAMPAWQGGGNMIQDVTFEKTVYHAAPARFEAGTGNIADAVGLGAAIDYVEHIGIDNINRYEHELLAYATRGLCSIPGLRLVGTATDKAGVLSFVLKDKPTKEVGAALNQEGIAVRSGHHCAQPILRRFGLEATVRPSLAMYNNCADIDALVAAVRRIQSGRNGY
jgi:cysteine desulfurase/selenocysteine lyase